MVVKDRLRRGFCIVAFVKSAFQAGPFTGNV